ncbi:unnamed protein product [Linum tenue]|uniref:Uncharacterized protein n=1 Tax=Linum tenue TaxID=586396 RepID=A0AAV0QTB0_9ROSI|nr:unnamed protein product [Linum tenue]
MRKRPQICSRWKQSVAATPPSISSPYVSVPSQLSCSLSSSITKRERGGMNRSKVDMGRDT